MNDVHPARHRRMMPRRAVATLLVTVAVIAAAAASPAGADEGSEAAPPDGPEEVDGLSPPQPVDPGEEPLGTEVDEPAPRAAMPPPPGLEWLTDERVLFIGDSLLEDATPALSLQLEAMGVAHRIKSVPGSGLGWDHALVDWPAEAARQVADFEPTVVVAELCCNYWPPYPLDRAGHPVPPGTRAFREFWGREARKVARNLTAGGAELHWVVTPPIDSVVETTRLVDAINDTTLEMIEQPRAGDPVPELIRWDLALTGGTGTWAERITIDGRRTRVRRDGIHFTGAGAAVAAETVLDAFADRHPVGPWAPFDVAQRPTQYAMANFLGLDPYDDAARLLLSVWYRAGAQSTIEHLDRLLHGPRWGEALAPMARLYQATLGRVPDADGLRYWTGQRAAGRSLGGIAASFVASPEFQAVYGPRDDGSFLRLLYANVLGRAADPGGYAYWVDQLDGPRRRRQVVASFSESAEFVARTAARTETLIVEVGLLDRVPSELPALGAPAPAIRSVTAGVLASPAMADAAEAFRP